MAEYFEYGGIKWKQISHSEHQQILYKMLVELDFFCRENGIRYYLTGGTMLGAIRHQGFIPWDDDIDVNIPRPDYDKLMQLSKGQIGKYRVGLSEDIYLAYGRMMDPDTLILNRFEGMSKKTTKINYSNIYIDLCPLDGLPSNPSKFKKHARLIGFLTGLRGSLYHGFFGKSFFKKMFRLLTYPLAKCFGKQRLLYWIDKLARKYDFDSSKYIGAVLTFNRMKDRLLREEYIPVLEVQFEKQKFFTTQMYKKHLEILYGPNYMIPPSDKNRQADHSINAWKKVES